jgi:Fe-S oxidoreductase
MLDLARRQLREVLEALGPAIAAGTPLVVLEPSCAAVFRDELPQLFPEDPAARRIAERTFTLASFLVRETSFTPPRLGGSVLPAIIQGHCHQQSVLGMEADRELLARLGLDAHLVEGCCGMAGAFGFAREHFEVSQGCGERALFPALRAAGPEALILADGFSCREQIAQGTGRRARHLAEVLRAK